MAQVTTIFDSSKYELRVHAAGCRDIQRDAQKVRGQGQEPYTSEAATQAQVAHEWFSDFIDYNDQDMTVEQALTYCVFLPCCKLPVGDLAAESAIARG